jgi:hypothetical protein
VNPKLFAGSGFGTPDKNSFESENGTLQLLNFGDRVYKGDILVIVRVLLFTCVQCHEYADTGLHPEPGQKIIANSTRSNIAKHLSVCTWYCNQTS